MNIVTLQQELINALISVDRSKALEILTPPDPTYNRFQYIEELVGPALEVIGAGWEKGDYSLSQVYMSGRICEELLIDHVLPASSTTAQSQPQIAIAVLEDYHLLGKRIVYSFMRSNGFELANYGRMDMDSLINNVLQDEIKILLISVLMLSSALRVKELQSRLHQAGSKVKIVVGGAPFRYDRQLWREVGADACGSTAADAVTIVKQLIKERS